VMVIIVLVGGTVAWALSGMESDRILVWIGDAHRVLETNTWLTGSALVVLFAVAVGIGLPGGSVFVLAGGYLFGLFYGLLLSLLGGLAGGLITLGMVRWARWRIEGHHLPLAWMNRHPFLLLLGLRNIPVLPFTLVSIVGGATCISVRNFAIATVLGSVPSMAMLALMGSRLSMHIGQPELVSVTGILRDPGIWIPLAALAALAACALPIRKRLQRRPRG